MTVVHPSSISGISSLTTAASSEVLSFHINNTSERLRITAGGMNVTGVVTATSFVGALTGNVTGTASNASGATGDFSIADKIIHTGDTNTAIRFPGADQIQLETNGGDRVYIQSDGKIGINRNSNLASFGRQVLIDGTVGLNNDSGAVGMGFHSGTSNTYGYIGTGAWAVNGGAADDFGITSGSTGDLLLGTAATERLRIDSSGRLLLGTTTVGRAGADEFTVGNASGDIGITIRSGTSNEGNIYFSDSTSAGNAEQRGIVRFNHSDDSMRFFTADGNNWPTEKLRIKSDGKIGIGTIAPATALHAYGGSTGFRLEREGSNPGYYNVAISHGTPSGANNYGSVYFTLSQTTGDYVWKSSSTERMRLLGDSGHLGINNDNPQSPIQAKGAGTGTLGAQAYPQLTLQTAATNGAADTGAGIMFLGHDGSGGAFHATIRGLKENGTSGNRDSYLSFGTRANGANIVERLRITSTGDVEMDGNFTNGRYTCVSANTAGDFSITVSGLTANAGNNWRKCGVMVIYNGINSDATSSKSAVGYYGVGSVTNWNWLGEDEEFTSDSLNCSLDNDTTTSFRLNFNVADQNSGSVTVFVNAWNVIPTVTIAG